MKRIGAGLTKCLVILVLFLVVTHRRDAGLAVAGPRRAQAVDRRYGIDRGRAGWTGGSQGRPLRASCVRMDADKML